MIETIILWNLKTWSKNLVQNHIFYPSDPTRPQMNFLLDNFCAFS